jgi:hypothetical protein
MAFNWLSFSAQFPEIARMTWPERHRIYSAAKQRLRLRHSRQFTLVLGMLCIFLFGTPILLLISRKVEASASLYLLWVVLLILLSTVAALATFLIWWRRAWRSAIRTELEAVELANRSRARSEAE